MMTKDDAMHFAQIDGGTHHELREAGLLPPHRPVSPPEADVIEALREADVANAMESGGWWQSCSGCYESNEGYPNGPYSTVLRAHLGIGCRECGGIGAVWHEPPTEEALSRLEASQPASEGSDLAAAPGGEEVERVARAICRAEGWEPDGDCGEGLQGWEYRTGEARAAIAAMRASPAAETAPDAGLVEAHRVLAEMWRSWTNGWSGNEVFDRYGKEIRAALSRAGERT